MTRILVTGANGFVGAPLVRALVAMGAEVHCVGSGAVPDPRARGHRLDLLSEDPSTTLAEVRASHLVHLAWITDHATYLHSAINLQWVEVSLRLLRRFAAAGGERFLGIGSGGAEYWPVTGACNEASSPTEPPTLYGQAKLTLSKLGERVQAELGIQWAWARLFWMYGPGQRGGQLVPSIIRSLAAGDVAYCRSPERVLDYLHVADVAEGLSALLWSDLCGAVNVSAGRGTRVGAIATTIAELMDRTSQVSFERASLDVRTEPLMVVGDNSRLATTGWRPRVQLEDGLAETIGSSQRPAGPAR